MKKGISIFPVFLLVIAIFWFGASNRNDTKEAHADVPDKNVQSQTAETETDTSDNLWVYKYDGTSGKSDFAPVGYMDEYTSLVADTDESLDEVITDSYMYLGSIKGYKNDDGTFEVYQVELTERNNLVLTNDDFELDYSGKREMAEANGWIYMDGTTILAVSPLYSETK